MYFDTEVKDGEKNKKTGETETKSSRYSLHGYVPIVAGVGAGVKLKNLMLEYSVEYIGSYGIGQRFSAGLSFGPWKF